MLRPVRLGPLSFFYTCDAVRRIAWHGTELVRAVAWPIRDESWGTFSPTILEERLEQNAHTFEGHLRFSVGDGRLDCILKIQATDEGELLLDLRMTTAKGPFATNRAGFTVLHPIKGFAGAPLTVTHSDGDIKATVFPKLISPDQPVFDIQRLRYALEGKTVDIAFSGDVFEMEDQRNWSDASYKTYCVPLVYPFTYEIDGSKSQSIRLVSSGNAGSQTSKQSSTTVTWQRSDDATPDIGLVVESGWMTTGDAIAQSGAGHIRARVGPTVQKEDLAQIASAAQGLDLDLELVINDEHDPATALADLKERMEGAGLAPTRIIALREGYLASHQPNGPWPDGPVPAQVVAAARHVYPGNPIGGGMLTNFTEFNRCRPDPTQCDFVTHGNTAIVHASDDLSVIETLETLPQIFYSASVIAKGTPYRLGLVSIGMRSNPYGAAVAENPNQERCTMAREDPRQRGLFAAAWAVGVLAATEAHPVESLCLAAPSGPFGIAYSRQPYPQPYFDETPTAEFFPIFHVIKTAAAMAGHPRLLLSGLPDGVHGYAAQTATGSRMMLANVMPNPQTVRLNKPARTAFLDTTTFTAATTQVDWLDTTSRQQGVDLNLEGFAVAFVDI